MNRSVRHVCLVLQVLLCWYISTLGRGFDIELSRLLQKLLRHDSTIAKNETHWFPQKINFVGVVAYHPLIL